MIDRNVVGRSRGFGQRAGKMKAVENAIENLSKCCYSIKVILLFVNYNHITMSGLLAYEPDFGY